MEKSKRTRRKWSKKQISNILTRYHRSGKSKREFCDLEGISYATFGNWYRNKRSTPDKHFKKDFIQVRLEAGHAGEPVAELILGNGRILKFYSMPDAGFVKSVLQ